MTDYKIRTILCVKDFKMKDGSISFKAGCEYEYFTGKYLLPDRTLFYFKSEGMESHKHGMTRNDMLGYFEGYTEGFGTGFMLELLDVVNREYSLGLSKSDFYNLIKKTLQIK